MGDIWCETRLRVKQLLSHSPSSRPGLPGSSAMDGKGEAARDEAKLPPVSLGHRQPPAEMMASKKNKDLLEINAEFTTEMQKVRIHHWAVKNYVCKY